MYSIQQLENEYLEAMFQETSFSDYWRGSDMGTCFRKRILHRKKIPYSNPISAIDRRKMDVGNLFHYKYQSFLQKLGILIEKEREIINEDYNFCGHSDAIIGGVPIYEIKPTYSEKMLNYLENFRKKTLEKFPNGLPLLLYDFKTQHSNSFSYLEKEGPSEFHIKQVRSYLLFEKIKKQYDILEGRLLYISKDDSRLLEFPVILTPELEKEILDELSSLNNFWEKGIIPDPLPEIIEEAKGRKTLNWQCLWCPYKDYCRGRDWEFKTKNQLKQKPLSNL